MKHLKFLLALAILSTFMSCQKNVDTSNEIAPLEDKDVTYFHHEETDEMLEFTSLTDLHDFIEANYSEHPDVDQILQKILVFKSELEYSQTLNLDDPLVAELYQARLDKRYGNNDNKTTLGVLEESNGTYLHGTAVPRNMRNNRRNRADVWECILPGSIFLCDRTWFRSPRLFKIGLPGWDYNLANNGFANRVESFF